MHHDNQVARDFPIKLHYVSKLISFNLYLELQKSYDYESRVIPEADPCTNPAPLGLPACLREYQIFSSINGFIGAVMKQKWEFTSSDSHYN